jgi:hypothetical protein
MDLSTFIVSVFCLIDDWLKSQQPLRQRGPAPKLHDSEVLTIEVIGEFLGIDTDKGLHEHFRRHHASFFPALCEVHRTTFARQAANLWALKERLWRHLLLECVGSETTLAIVDSFPVSACRRARSHRCRVLAGLAAYGYDEVNRTLHYGMRAHLLVVWPGVIARIGLAPANVHDLHPAEQLLEGTGRGWVLGDRNYWSPDLAERLRCAGGPELLTPYKVSKKERSPWPRWLVQKRRRVETVIGQLVGRYNAKKVWARDAWHLHSRWLRKVLSHTVAVCFCQQANLQPLRFSELLTD